MSDGSVNPGPHRESESASGARPWALELCRVFARSHTLLAEATRPTWTRIFVPGANVDRLANAETSFHACAARVYARLASQLHTAEDIRAVHARLQAAMARSDWRDCERHLVASRNDGDDPTHG
jgi:hypothetical protein